MGPRLHPTSRPENWLLRWLAIVTLEVFGAQMAYSFAHEIEQTVAAGTIDARPWMALRSSLYSEIAYATARVLDDDPQCKSLVTLLSRVKDLPVAELRGSLRADNGVVLSREQAEQAKLEAGRIAEEIRASTAVAGLQVFRDKYLAHIDEVQTKRKESNLALEAGEVAKVFELTKSWVHRLNGALRDVHFNFDSPFQGDLSHDFADCKLGRDYRAALDEHISELRPQASRDTMEQFPPGELFRRLVER